MNKGLSIIIVNYNSTDDIRILINSIKKYESIMYDDNKIEIIIVDNGSIEAEFDKLNLLSKENDNVIIIDTKVNNGFGKGNNIGVKYANHDNLLFINSDTYLTSSFIGKSLSKLGKEADILGVQLFNIDGTKQESCGYFPGIIQSISEILGLYKINIAKRFFKPFCYVENSSRELNDVDYVSGACFFIKKDTYIKVNGFDENFFLYYEETDLFYRLKLLGYRIKLLNIKGVVHKGSSVTGEFSKFKAKCYYESYLKYINKNCEKKKLLLYLNKVFIYEKFLLAKILKNKHKEDYYKIAIEILNSN